MPTFTGYLRERSDDELVALLRSRPDLASPSPATLSSLAVRATSRSSLERALAAVDASVLQVVEAVVALSVPGPVVAADLPAAVGATDEAGAALVERALRLAIAAALVYPESADPDAPLVASPGLAELLGPYPAGLAPADAVNRRGTSPAPVDLDDLPALLEAAPTGARPVLDALLWGSPVGLAPSNHTAAAAAVDWLIRRHLLLAGESRHVVLPRAVALALRGGRTHPAPAFPPSLPDDVPHRPASLVAAESAAAGERIVLLVARLVRLWEQSPPGVLRGGGLGVRELRRAAAALDVDEREAAFVIELANAAAFIADDGEDSPSFAPTVAVDEWAARDVPDRWVTLARAWRSTQRTPWLVGGRDERGGVRAALDPELQRTWAPRLRRSVLDVLAEAPPGTVLDAAHVVAALRWRSPRSVPPASAVQAVLVEAGRLGVLGAGALSEAGRALLQETDPAAAPADPAAALAAALPPAVDEVLLQGDLTGVVPGRPSGPLEDLLDRTAHIESRGGALTVRFTPETVRRALDAGATADALLAELEAHSRGGVPQPLQYLVRDAARRHGQLRVGSASAYIRTDDPALLAGLVEDQRLSSLGLVRLAPTVLAAHAPLRELVEALRAHGLAPVAEGPDGQVVHVSSSIRRVGRRAAAGARRRASDAAPASTRESVSDERLLALVPQLRRAEAERAADEVERVPGTVLPPVRRAPAPAAAVPTATTPDVGTADPVDALVLLREAAAEKAEVWVEMIGSHGVPQRRLLRPLRVEGGRLRAIDPARESELTVAVHRIATVTRAAPAPSSDQHQETS
ncbi:helicase-associated domain-containing protein [Cellulomonas fengjieae]|uniref:Helicase-associated domain-containing protein n=1 Tax=Cellulomonas fengjieae TaxID=2819978 RepID=A0ABS3SGT4_9CELL|nr:helicase-associated domain-containing protein [Cellulomonas fengjieae]MBO3084961.1 helicase-associated domain-containing protein [Cellulomonas fengjieae]QVI66439.1 helicase-associated domain-containing protein [Cellulomonas fengjieae]